MKYFIFLEESDWRSIDTKLNEAEALGQRELTVEEKRTYGLFRQIDRRVEWNCERTVFIHNLLVAQIVVTVLMSNSANIGTLFERLFSILKFFLP